ncbi:MULTISPECIES: hypothetical protein [unclassified Endozoicomonas]|uniref:hypothetical protein n=1 Tax=unclassified Endozoicomonas TaxID=2644528 RepID=UPI0021489524|nr:MULTISPECIES: hypothetical protein [unclassified Endozoicomonas]
MLPSQKPVVSKLQAQFCLAPKLELDKELDLPATKKCKAGDSSELKGWALKKRKIESKSLNKPSDIDEIKELKALVSKMGGALGGGITLSDEVKIKDKEKMISLFNLMHACLEKYELNEVPDKYPDLINIKEAIEDTTGLFKSVCDGFVRISCLRSCVNIDQVFLAKLHDYLGDDTCLEVYAGNGWLASELKLRGCNIVATDNFSRFDKERSRYSPFLRNVEKVNASDAVADFIGKLQNKERGAILVCFPEGDLNELKLVFKAPVQNPDIRIIAIGANAAMCCMPESLSNSDITETIAYTPSMNGERVIEYRST